MDLSKMIKWLGWNELPPEFLSSLCVCLIIIILSVVLYFKIKAYDPLKKPTGIVHAWEILVSFADKQVDDLMGPVYSKGIAGGYIITLGVYILLGFVWGMLGLPNVLQPGSRFTYTNDAGEILTATNFLKPMPNPFTNTAMPLGIALITFFWLHITAMKCRGWNYFHRYIDPIPLFLPINLITMWSGTLSLTLRLFGNALAGFCVVTLIYSGFGQMFSTTMAGLAITPIISPFVHLYFDLFDGAIQLAVFCMLTMIDVSNEFISKEDFIAEQDAKKQAKIDSKNDRAKRKHAKLEKKLNKLAIKAVKREEKRALRAQ